MRDMQICELRRWISLALLASWNRCKPFKKPIWPMEPCLIWPTNGVNLTSCAVYNKFFYSL